MNTNTTAFYMYKNGFNIEQEIAELKYLAVNVIDLSKTENWRLHEQAVNQLFNILRSDLAKNLDQNNKNLLALLVINVVWAKHFAMKSVFAQNFSLNKLAELFEPLDKSINLTSEYHYCFWALCKIRYLSLV